MTLGSPLISFMLSSRLQVPILRQADDWLDFGSLEWYERIAPFVVIALIGTYMASTRSPWK